MKYYQNIVAQFIPIIIIFLFLSKNKEFIAFSKTILGKIISIGLIIFYTIIDKFLGLFICAIIILFYQYKYKESFDFIQDNIEYIQDNIDIQDNIETQDNIEYIEDPILIDIDNTDSSIKKYKNNKDIFRKENCKNGYLKYKDMNVKNEMAEHIFPELKFNNVLCNPCNKTCNISIIDNKLKQREIHGFP